MTGDSAVPPGAAPQAPDPLKITLSPPSAADSSRRTSDTAAEKKARGAWIRPVVEVIRQVCRWIRAVLRRWKIPPAVWKALLITAVGAFVITRWDFSGSPVDSTASQRTDCPSDVTRYFAPGAEDAVLVEAYHTASFVVTICQDASGALHYDGRKRGLPVTPRTHIALPAQKDPFGHVARNGTFEYRMTGSRLVVTNSGRVLVDEAATLISP